MSPVSDASFDALSTPEPVYICYIDPNGSVCKAAVRYCSSEAYHTHAAIVEKADALLYSRENFEFLRELASHRAAVKAARDAGDIAVKRTVMSVRAARTDLKDGDPAIYLTDSGVASCSTPTQEPSAIPDTPTNREFLEDTFKSISDASLALSRLSVMTEVYKAEFIQRQSCTPE